MLYKTFQYTLKSRRNEERKLNAKLNQYILMHLKLSFKIANWRNFLKLFIPRLKINKQQKLYNLFLHVLLVFFVFALYKIPVHD